MYVGNNPVNYIDPTGMFTCSPMPECREWILYALVQLDVSGDIFSDFVYNFFMDLDEKSGGDRFNISFTGKNWNMSAINYKITLQQKFINDNLPVPISHVGIFAHEIIHQTQTPIERISVWGEAQAYIFQVLVQEELGKDLTKNFGEPLIELAFDLGSPGFTTRDEEKLKKVRKLILDEIGFSILYLLEPLLPLEDPTSFSHCWDL